MLSMYLNMETNEIFFFSSFFFTLLGFFFNSHTFRLKEDKEMWNTYIRVNSDWSFSIAWHYKWMLFIFITVLFFCVQTSSDGFPRFVFFRKGFYGNCIFIAFWHTFIRRIIILSFHPLTPFNTVCPSILTFSCSLHFLQQIQCMSTSKTHTTITSTLLTRIINMRVNVCRYY